MGTPTILLARTDAEAADLVTTDVRRERQALPDRRAHGGRLLPHQEGLRPGHQPRPRLCRVCRPDLVRDRHARPGVRQGLRRRRSTPSSRASCWPTTARRRSTGRRTWTTRTIAKFQKELGAMGYKFQFITLAGFHSLNYTMFELAYGYARNNMTAFVETAAEGVRRRRQGLHRREAPARGGHGLLRRRDDHDRGERVHAPEGLDRGSSSRHERRAVASTKPARLFGVRTQSATTRQLGPAAGIA